jgi:hypothetical protein
MAQDTKAPPAATITAAPEQKADTGLMLTPEEVKTWVGKPVYSSDGKNLGDVAGFERAADNKVIKMQADIGGFLGMGEHRINLMPAQFTLHTDRIVLELTSAEAKALPKVAK